MDGAKVGALLRFWGRRGHIAVPDRLLTSCHDPARAAAIYGATGERDARLDEGKNPQNERGYSPSTDGRHAANRLPVPSVQYSDRCSRRELELCKSPAKHPLGGAEKHYCKQRSDGEVWPARPGQPYSACRDEHGQ